MFKKLSKMMVAILLSIAALGAVAPNQVQAAAPTVLKVGYRTSDVWDLQYRLNQIGIETQVDGTFGWQTRRSVITFQRKYGLVPDGIVGSATWRALKQHTYSKTEFDLLTRLVYSEARGESYQGQVAVAAVVLNRVHVSQFPNTIRGVIFQPGAFTAVNDGQFWMQPNATAARAARDAIRGWDPSRNSLYYFNPNTATSKWIWSRPQMIRIGNHIFTK